MRDWLLAHAARVESPGSAIPVRPSRLAPTSHSQASRRQLAAGGVVLMTMAMVFLLLRPDTGPGEEAPVTP